MMQKRGDVSKKRQRREAILEEICELLLQLLHEDRQQMLDGQLGLFGNEAQGRFNSCNSMVHCLLIQIV